MIWWYGYFTTDPYYLKGEQHDDGRSSCFKTNDVFLVSESLLGLFGLLAYRGKSASAGPVLIGGLATALIPKLDNGAEFEAGLTGLKLKVAEASNVLDGLRKLAIVTSRSLIDIQVNAGVLGGASAKDRDRLKTNVVEVLASIGVGQAAIDQVSSEDRNRSLSEYFYGIQKHILNVTHPMNSSSVYDYEGEFNGIIKAFPPSPAAIEGYLLEHKFGDEFTAKALDEYRYYLEHEKHRDVSFWAERDNWPTNP